MPSRRATYKSFDFWIILFVTVTALAYTVLSEVCPIDWFMISRPFKKDPDFIYKKTFSRLFIASKDLHICFYERYLEDPEKLFDKTSHLFKNRQDKTKVALVEIEGRHYVVKKYQIPNFKCWLKGFPFRSSKAYRAWHYANQFIQLAIPTAKPLLIIEKRIGPFWTNCYILNDFIDGWTGQEFFSQTSSFKDQWPFALKELRKLIDTLNELHIIHGDLSLGNFIIQDGKPYLLDLDRIHLYHFNHAFYKRRYQTQHLSKLNRKLKELNPEAQELYQEIFQLPVKNF